MKGSVDGHHGRGGDVGPKRAEIYTYEFDHEIYAMNWSNMPDRKWRLAVGSYLESSDKNVVEMISLDDESGMFMADKTLEFEHGFPPTKLMFCPESGLKIFKKDLLITSSDILRLWEVTEDGTKKVVELQNGSQRMQNKSDYDAPLTSFDWNDGDPRKVGTASIDTTCTIWDIEKGQVETQLIAHDKEVHDFAWGGLGVFASVSADGSVRVFDLRDKEHSTIIFESPTPSKPLLRLGWNKQDPRYMATIMMDSMIVFVLDIRFPAKPVAELHRHNDCVNALAWAPQSSTHICTAGEDAQALIWSMNNTSEDMRDTNPDPILAYTADSPLSQLQWSSLQYDWVAIGFANKAQILRVG